LVENKYLKEFLSEMFGTTIIVVTALATIMPVIMSSQIRSRLYHFLKVEKSTQINLSIIVINANLVEVTGTLAIFESIFVGDMSSLY